MKGENWKILEKISEGNLHHSSSFSYFEDYFTGMGGWKTAVVREGLNREEKNTTRIQELPTEKWSVIRHYWTFNNRLPTDMNCVTERKVGR